MSRKKANQRHMNAPATPAQLQARLQRTIQNGDFQRALELAKQLYRQDPIPEHQKTLRNLFLVRARQLREQRYIQDAVDTLQTALKIECDEAEWLADVALELAACGETTQALQVLQPFPDSPVRAQVLEQAADFAIEHHATGGRAQLPAELQADFDQIVKAFTQVEDGTDEQARETLNAIPLRSPFLAWKLLLRGLMAFYNQEDSRALENWQRLNSKRLPAHLAAPFRFLIDPSFRTAQAPNAQSLLQKQADELQGSSVAQELRLIQSALTSEESLARVFRLAEGVMPHLQREAPHLVARLAACFYWAIVTRGEREDIPRYRRVFGAPADDPQFDRLSALMFENERELEEAHRYWQKFEKAIAETSSQWPAGQAERARAIIWLHMGHNAASVPDQEELKQMPFLSADLGILKPLKPSAEKCFQRSVELAPDRLEAHEALFRYYQERTQSKKAVQTAQRLLERFPDHVATIVELGDLQMQAGRFDEGIRCFQRAIPLNPLDRDLRSRLSGAYTFNARKYVEAGQFDKARAEYQRALAEHDASDKSAVLCKWAGCEFKAGEPERAEELLQQAFVEAGSQLSVAYGMLIEVIRLKLPRPLKTRLDKDFNRLLSESPSGPSAAKIAAVASAHHVAGTKYTGQKTHEKKVKSYLEKALLATDWTEEQLEQVCAALDDFKASKLTRSYAELGQQRFPRNPYFYIWEMETYVALGPWRCPTHVVKGLLDKARQFAGEMPPSKKRDLLFKILEQREAMIATLNPFRGVFSPGMMDDIFGDYDDDDDDDDYEE